MRKIVAVLVFILLMLLNPAAYAYIDDELLEEDENLVNDHMDYLIESLDEEDYEVIDSRVREIRDLYSFSVNLEPGTYHAWAFGGYEIIDLGIFVYDENNEEVAGDNNARPRYSYDIYEELYGRVDEIPEIGFSTFMGGEHQFEIEVFGKTSDRDDEYYYSDNVYEEFYERGYVGFLLVREVVH